MNIQYDFNIPTLEDEAYDPFEISSELLLTDDFSDLTNWHVIGKEDFKSESFTKIEDPSCSGGSALKVLKGSPSMGRIVDLNQRNPILVCARMKLPPGASFDELKDLFCVGELKVRSWVGLNNISKKSSVAIRFSWRQAQVEGEWINLYQAFIPRWTARSLVVSINTMRADDLKGPLLLDRVMVRHATMDEVVALMFDQKEQDSTYSAKSVMRQESGLELRDSLVMVVPGELRLPIAPGPERLFRFGLTFPAALAPNHGQHVTLRVDLDDGTEADVPLHEELLDLTDPKPYCFQWNERVVRIPPLEHKAELVLRGKCEDEKNALLVWGAPLLVIPRSPATPPNVVLISIDTLRADRLGVYGGYHKEGISPFLDSLAGESVVFEKAFAQAPFTLPSHVSMLSGQYPTVHRVLKPPSCIDHHRTAMIAPILARAGYVTGAFTGGLLMKHIFGFDQGFDTYFEWDPCRNPMNMQRLKDWVEANKNLPFFLFVHTYAVHHFAFDNPKYVDRFDPDCTSPVHNSATRPNWLARLAETKAYTDVDLQCLNNRYAAGIRLSDDSLQRLVKFMKSLDMLDNTWIIVTSDHGKELLDRGMIQHGRTLYEELIRVPLFIRPPGGANPPRRIHNLVEVLDIPITILDILDIPLPLTVQGRSLCSYLSSDGSEPIKHVAFSEVDSRENLYAFRTEDWKIIYDQEAGGGSGASQEGYELYNLTDDPEEKVNLAPDSEEFKDYRERMDLFRKRLESLSKSIKGYEGQGVTLDPELLEELRQQGYIQ